MSKYKTQNEARSYRTKAVCLKSVLKRCVCASINLYCGIYNRNLCFKNIIQRVYHESSVLLFSFVVSYISLSLHSMAVVNIIVYLGCVSIAFWVLFISMVFSFFCCMSVCALLLLVFVKAREMCRGTFQNDCFSLYNEMNWQRVKWEF